MALHRDEGADPFPAAPLDRPAGIREERRSVRTSRVALGSLACPQCDAPVVSPPRPSSPTHPLACPFCAHAAPLRDFLSLGAPLRAPVVAVRVAHR